MKTRARHQISLPPHRAFVVQFNAEADPARDYFAGRVEHVVSGQAAHFQSLEDLRLFMARVLVAVIASPDET